MMPGRLTHISVNSNDNHILYCSSSRFRALKTSTPKGNCVLTPRPRPGRESESFDGNRTRWTRPFRTPAGTAAKQRHLTFWVARRKPHETLGKTKKTPGGILSAFSVNWTGSESSLIS